MAKTKSWKIKDGLYVNEVPVEMEDQTSVIKDPEHQYIIIDRFWIYVASS